MESRIKLIISQEFNAAIPNDAYVSNKLLKDKTNQFSGIVRPERRD